jgi:long-chain acyl-CoA synthetase
LHPDDLAVLQYTGGTTGVPKAAMLTQGNLSANTQQVTLWFTGGQERPKQDKVLAVLPFFHSFGMIAQMSLGISTGSEILLVPEFEIKSVLKTINDEKPTIFAGVPTIYKAITDCKTVGNYDLSSLEVCISGAAPLSAETMQAFKTLTGIELLEGYGLSESSAAATANPLNGMKRTGSIGMPLPGTEVKLVPQDPTALVRLPGADVPVVVQGEICLRGPQIMKGYWKRDDETALVLDKDGWLHTGDIGRFDDDGYLNIVGRIKDMIIASGLKVFPRKVEEAVLKNEAVDDVAVIGVKDAYRGENVKAFIVLKEGKTLNAADLTAFLKDHLASYEVPKLVEFRDSLPLTMIGKPDKKELKRQEAEKEAQQQVSKPPKRSGPAQP